MSEWRPVFNYEGLYDVSADGQVRSLPRRGKRGRVLAGVIDSRGYMAVNLCRSGGQRVRRIHVLVAEAFHGRRQQGQVVRHLDGNPLNNQAGNLAWGTYRDNEDDKVRHGTGNPAKTHCPQGHEYSPENTYNPPVGGRQCRACHRERERRHRNGAAVLGDMPEADEFDGNPGPEVLGQMLAALREMGGTE